MSRGFYKKELGSFAWYDFFGDGYPSSINNLSNGLGGCHMLDEFFWKVFEQTGNIDAYLGMIEYQGQQEQQEQGDDHTEFREASLHERDVIW